MSDQAVVVEKDYASELAQASAQINATTLRPKEPYTWASGFRMPIYNDNRKHLRYPKHRKLITDAFEQIVKEQEISVDGIAGTSTAGIAPAASLAQRLHLPLVVIENDLVYQYDPDAVNILVDNILALARGAAEYDVVVSTCPGSILPAVFYANIVNLPFAYVREKQKAHGLQQQIEGIIDVGERVLLLDFHNNYSYVDRAMEAVRATGADVKFTLSKDIFTRYRRPDDGMKLLQVEDLVSTGGSTVGEIKIHKEPEMGPGRPIEHCLAIFSYDFPEALQLFEGVGVQLHTVLGYERLLQVYSDLGKITADEHEMLKGWRKDAFNWGEKHGFPKVEKK